MLPCGKVSYLRSRFCGSKLLPFSSCNPALCGRYTASPNLTAHMQECCSLFIYKCFICSRVFLQHLSGEVFIRAPWKTGWPFLNSRGARIQSLKSSHFPMLSPFLVGPFKLSKVLFYSFFFPYQTLYCGNIADKKRERGIMSHCVACPCPV